MSESPTSVCCFSPCGVKNNIQKDKVPYCRRLKRLSGKFYASSHRGGLKHIGEAQVAVAAVVDDLARKVGIGRGIADGGDDLLGGAALAFGDLLGRRAIG